MTGILVRMSAAAALLAATSTQPVIAQTAEKTAGAAGLEEVVVTATRREERLQDVPISVSAFSQEKLDSQGLKNIDDLSRLSPGVTFSRNGTGSSANYNDENSDISIRGIDSSAGSSTTGVYIDDTPVQSRHIGFGAVNVFPQLFDIERVEVLRGPQGTLFGAGAEGGALRFITPAPNMVGTSGYARAETAWTDGGDPSYELGAAVGTALIDDVLGLRVSASYRRDGGWVDRATYTVDTSQSTLLPTIAYAGTTEKAANWQDTMTLRAALKWKASDTVTVAPSIYYQRLHINDSAIYWPALSDASSGVFRNGNQLKNPSTDPFYLGAIKIDWDVTPGVHFVSNTSYYSRNQYATSDYTQYLRVTWALYGNVLYPPPAQPIPYPNTYPQPGDAGYAPFRDEQHNFYQEFRLTSTDPNARLTWTAGLYYAHTNENVYEDIFDNNLEAETGGGVCAWIGVTCPNGQILHLPEQRNVEKQIAGFGEVGFKITETVKATVGLRVARIDIDGTSAVGGAFNFAPLEPLVAAESKTSETPVTPKFVLGYQPDRDNLFYASASKGYRSGGVNYAVAPG
jgi:iron complex outermembrane receptor protein